MRRARERSRAREGLVELRKFALELAIASPALGRKSSVVESGPHGAVRFALVPAVRESALSRERGDVLERLLEAVVRDPEVKLPHARVVHDETSARKDDELSARRRVLARPVCSDIARSQPLLSGERVDERRLSDTRGAEKSGGDPGAQVRANVVEPEPGADRDRVDGSSESSDAFGHSVCVGHEVGLRQKQDRLRAALPDKGEIALEDALVDIGERGDDEDDVDVRGHDLFARDVRPGIVGGAA